MFIHRRFSFLFEPADGVVTPAPADSTVKPADQVATPPRHGWLNDDFTFVPSWQDQLPDNLKAEYAPLAANYKDLGGLLKSLKDSKQAAMEKAGLKVPAADAKPEAWAEFHKALGVPEKPEGYGFKEPDDAALKPFYNAEAAKEFAADAHKLGLTPQQANGLLSMYLKNTAAMDAKQQAEGQQFLKERETELRKLWGDKYEASMLDATRVAVTFGMNKDELIYLPPSLMTGLAAFAQQMGENKLVSREQLTNNLSSADMARDIQLNEKNPDYAAYHDNTHPNHEAVKARVLEMNKLPETKK